MTKPKLAMASGAGLAGAMGVGGGAYWLSESLNGFIDTFSSSKGQSLRSQLQGDKFEILDVNENSSHWATEPL